MRKLTAIFAAAFLAMLPSWAAGQQDWSVYRDKRFGMQINFPASLLDTVEENREGVVIAGPDARLEMSARQVPGLANTQQLRELVEQTEGYENVTYSPGGNRWLVVSGYRGDDIFYEKFFLSRGLVRGFSMQYPVSLRRLYDPVVERMEDSFKAEPR